MTIHNPIFAAFDIHGLRLHSTVPGSVPHLQWREADSRGSAEIQMYLEKVPTSLANSRFERNVEIARNTALINLQQAGRILIEDGTKITVQTGDPEKLSVLFSNIMATALPLTLLQRGRPLLHGSCVEKDGRAICFLGESGAGKSTAARVLVENGYRLISDDIIAPLVENERFRVFPVSNGIRLDPLPKELAGGGHWRSKRPHPMDSSKEARSADLVRVVLLEWSFGRQAAVETIELKGFDAFERIYKNIFRPDLVRGMRMEALHASFVGQMSKSLSVEVVRRPRDDARLQEFVAEIDHLMDPKR